MLSVIFLTVLALCHNVELVIVRVNEGWLQGETRPLSTRRGVVHCFKGIPYAEPPVGKLRFKAPRPHRGWKGIRDATKHGAICSQYDMSTQQIPLASENCLFLNVYTPILTPRKLLSVMVYLHGGGWMSGSGNDAEYGPDFLVYHNVILVTMNYRLEVLGNLCLDTKEVPGNAGMKDQSLALKWVRNNIRHFGGDPGKVTLMGESAGGTSVIYHMMSPMSRGLFCRGIPMSGVPDIDWAIPFQSRERAFALGRELGLNTTNVKDLLEFLETIEVEKLLKRSPAVISQEELWGDNIIMMLNFVPVAEKDFGQERFLDKTPKEALKRGDIADLDLLIGYTKNEYGVFIPLLEDSSSDLNMAQYNMYPELLIPHEILLKIAPNQVLPLAREIHRRYFGDRVISPDTMVPFVNLINDRAFIYNVNRFVRNLQNVTCSNTFLYKFITVSGRNRNAKVTEKYGMYGCTHLDDLRYYFDAKSDPAPVIIGSREDRLIRDSCRLWTNFAKYGDPTPDDYFGVRWLPYDNENKNYMNINDVIRPGKYPDARILNWWYNIYKKYGVELP